MIRDFSDIPQYDRREGADIVTARDSPRLEKQMVMLKDIMMDHRWHTLNELEAMTDFPQASISAQLRHLRKKRFGSYIVDRKYLGTGVYAYRIRGDGELGI